ncbi:hypothetical protein [Mycobacteroides abscessus]|uniref:hypothetical protein n=1 Tax=Mycobacteroides abscessus TaxID=36809 RepID=UPI001F2C3F15|nr:hypothetical protein [Mycobacteroides abscessus]
MSMLEPSRSHLALPPLSPPWARFDARLNRATRQQLATIEATVAIKQAGIDAVAEVQRAKIDVVTSTGGYAMQRAALVGQMQQQLALASPVSSGDLDFLKSLTMVAVGQVVADTASKVNRL